MGAELQAAILQRKNQLKPVAVSNPVDLSSRSQQEASNDGKSAVRAMNAGTAAPTMEELFRKGLQRMQQYGPQDEDDTGGDTEFLAATIGSLQFEAGRCM